MKTLHFYSWFLKSVLLFNLLHDWQFEWLVVKQVVLHEPFTCIVSGNKDLSKAELDNQSDLPLNYGNVRHIGSLSVVLIAMFQLKPHYSHSLIFLIHMKQDFTRKCLREVKAIWMQPFGFFLMGNVHTSFSTHWRKPTNN